MDLAGDYDLTLDHDLAISLDQMTYLSSVDYSSFGPLVTDLVNHRSSHNLDICDLTDAQSASTSLYYFQVIPRLKDRTTIIN